MSHNITVKMGIPCSMIQSAPVKSILEEELGWKILGPGIYKGYSGRDNIKADVLVAIPVEQAPRWGERKRIDGKDYMVIALQEESAPDETVTTPTGRTYTKPGMKTTKMTLDQGYGEEGVKQREAISNNIMGVIEGAILAEDICPQIMDTLSSQGVQTSVSSDDIKRQIIEGARSGQDVLEMEIRFTNAAPSPGKGRPPGAPPTSQQDLLQY